MPNFVEFAADNAFNIRTHTPLHTRTHTHTHTHATPRRKYFQNTHTHTHMTSKMHSKNLEIDMPNLGELAAGNAFQHINTHLNINTHV